MLLVLLFYEFLPLDTYHPDTLYVPEQACDDPWYCFEAKRGPRAKNILGKHDLIFLNIIQLDDSKNNEWFQNFMAII